VQRLEGKPLLHGEQSRPFADEQEMRSSLHDALRERGDVTNVLDPGDAAAAERPAFHDAGVERHRADAVGDAAVADRAGRSIVFDRLSAGQRRIERRLPLPQQRQRRPHGNLPKAPGRDRADLRHVDPPASPGCSKVAFHHISPRIPSSILPKPRRYAAAAAVLVKLARLCRR
jgi:hypothetical protein